jgi:transposase
MWTSTTRQQHSRPAARYQTDLTDKEWRLIEPHLPAALKTGRPRAWPMREIGNAIFSVLRGGIAWRLLPSDFPPWSTVYLSPVRGLSRRFGVREDQPRPGHGGSGRSTSPGCSFSTEPPRRPSLLPSMSSLTGSRDPSDAAMAGVARRALSLPDETAAAGTRRRCYRAG